MNRSLGNVAKYSVPLLALCILFVDSSSALAFTRTWVNFGSGDFNNPNNWFEPSVPGPGDFVSFEVGSGNPYTVTFPGNELGVGGTVTANYTTEHLRVRDNAVTFAGSTQAGRGPSTYTVASPTLTEANRGIIIGVFGGENAVLNVSNFGMVCCGRLSSVNTAAATIGDFAGANGTLNMNTGVFSVTGSGSAIDVYEHELIVGNHGTGTLNVNNGADVHVSGFVGTTSLGNHATGVGTVNVSGAGSTWSNEWRLYVGLEGRGTFTVQNGGTFIGSITQIGAFPGGTGTVTVTGSGSTWTNTSGSFYVGGLGQGFVNIENGGVMSGSFGNIDHGAAVVTGAGSRWNNSGTVNVSDGPFGGQDATLNVSDGGVVVVGTDPDGNGQLRVWRSGTLDGDGTIEGDVRSHGFVAPGNSTGVLTITGNYTQHDDGYISVEIFGLNQGAEYDLLDVGGAADLAGVLEVDVTDSGYTPALGDTFEILRAADGVFGFFDVDDLPAIGPNVRLTTIYGADNVTLAVVPIQTGDFNANGIVDAADYTVWRNSLGQTGLALPADGDGSGGVDATDYGVWRSHFGETPGIGIIASGATPEPTTAVLIVLASVLLLSGRRIGCCKRTIG